MDRRARQAIVRGISKSQTQQAMDTHTHICAHARTHIHTHTILVLKSIYLLFSFGETTSLCFIELK